MKGKFARQLIVLHARSPQSKASPLERVEGRAHAPANRAEPEIFCWREQPTLTVVPQVLAHDSPFAFEREDDCDYRAGKYRYHDQKVDGEEYGGSGHCGAIPCEMQKHRRKQTQNRHEDL